MLYEDRHVALDETSLLIKRYYFPIPRSKRIAYTSIRRITEASIPAGPSRALRLWGSWGIRYWYHIDTTRFGKERQIILDVRRPVRPVITPDDHDAVMEILTDKTAAGR